MLESKVERWKIYLIIRCSCTRQSSYKLSDFQQARENLVLGQGEQGSRDDEEPTSGRQEGADVKEIKG